MDEGIETCQVNLLKKTIEKTHHTVDGNYIGQGTLNELPFRNEFLKNLILKICEPLIFYSSNLHVGIKLHRRLIDKGTEIEVKGLDAHKDYDSDIIVMMKIEQKNIAGGRNQITNDSHTVLMEDSIPVPGGYIYVDNTQLFHALTPMSLIDLSEIGYRDVMIFEIKKVI